MNGIINNLLSELVPSGAAFPLEVPNGDNVIIVPSVIATAVGLTDTADLRNRARYVLIEVQGAPLKVTYDDTDPSTATEFYTMRIGDSPVWRVQTFLKARFSGDGADSKLVCQIMQRA